MSHESCFPLNIDIAVAKHRFLLLVIREQFDSKPVMTGLFQTGELGCKQPSMRSDLREQRVVHIAETVLKKTPRIHCFGWVWFAFHLNLYNPENTNSYWFRGKFQKVNTVKAKWYLTGFESNCSQMSMARNLCSYIAVASRQRCLHLCVGERLRNIPKSKNNHTS